MLTVKNLQKTFHSKKVIDDISFNVLPGQIVIFLGESGVGKSTIIRILNNLETFDSGTILLHDQPINFKDVGMVFQNFNLFDHLTIEQNITLALTEVAHCSEQKAKKRAHDLLVQFNLADKKDAYPASLSGGQKQRVALARTLAMHPKVLCLDEPTSALDPMLTLSVAQTIQELAKSGYMIIIATHDTDLLRNLHATIHLMKNGKIIESAHSEELTNEATDTMLIKNFIKGNALG